MERTDKAVELSGTPLDGGLYNGFDKQISDKWSLKLVISLIQLGPVLWGEGQGGVGDAHSCRR